MILYPTIELHRGRCVSLYRGRLDEPQIWHVDPVEKAREFAQAGASWMQLTDFDALAGNDRNRALVIEIIRAAGIPVQLAGGFRSRERVEDWIEQGAGRVVIGTLAVQDPALVQELAKYYPDQIVLAVDVMDGKLMVEGWTQSCAITPEAFIESFAQTPLAAIKITDINTDIEGTEASIGVISGLAAACRTPVIASGVIHGIDDVARLKYVPGVSGAVLGRALFNRTVDLETALKMAQPEPEETAEFL